MLEDIRIEKNDKTRIGAKEDFDLRIRKISSEYIGRQCDFGISQRDLVCTVEPV
jgi:hypothetical protein